MKILLVDDEANVRDVIRYFGQWERLGITEIREAANGEEAKKLIVQEQPEIVLTDIKMPKVDGLMLLEWLATEIEYTGKVIILSGHDDYLYMRKAIHYGTYDYLMKPVEPEALNTVLEGAIHAWRNESEKRRDIASGIYDQVKRERLSRNIIAACEGRPYDRDDLEASIPKAEACDLTLLYFYQAHQPDHYVKLLSDNLTERGWGNIFSVPSDRHIGVMITERGKFREIEQWIRNHFDIPVRLASGSGFSRLEDLPYSFKEANRAFQLHDFRTIHQLNESDDSRRMQDMIAYVNRHFTEEISLDVLARRFFLSREHISRRLKQELGMTLSDFLIQLRVEQAKKWLCETDENMFTISTKLGYQDEKYFSKLFKRRVGMTPMEYRNGNGGRKA
ncbi:response regulator [Cohnella sp. CFH 77786]|uniref:response regulator n=1 Tax=Cohnella sp. CFH 77786 TaxID=2662265 RepID=UPI001C610E3E|nr:response regulator [Cohnella sp. CFH 77786]MBW5446496.1 response regulator [Cohnella sp. CFH 77786]